jgi:hypothetical protein
MQRASDILMCFANHLKGRANRKNKLCVLCASNKAGGEQSKTRMEIKQCK